MALRFVRHSTTPVRLLRRNRRSEWPESSRALTVPTGVRSSSRSVTSPETSARKPSPSRYPSRSRSAIEPDRSDPLRSEGIDGDADQAVVFDEPDPKVPGRLKLAQPSAGRVEDPPPLDERLSPNEMIQRAEQGVLVGRGALPAAEPRKKLTKLCLVGG